MRLLWQKQSNFLSSMAYSEYRYCKLSTSTSAAYQRDSQKTVSFLLQFPIDVDYAASFIIFYVTKWYLTTLNILERIRLTRLSKIQ